MLTHSGQSRIEPKGTRMVFVLSVALAALFGHGRFVIADQPIDRQTLVSRHNIVVHEIDPNGAMAVGNGEFAFNFDVTGLQSFPSITRRRCRSAFSAIGVGTAFRIRTATRSTIIHDVDRQARSRVRLSGGQSRQSVAGRRVFARQSTPFRTGADWFGDDEGRRLAVAITDLKNIDQRLDLWGGIATSSFEVDGAPVRVETAVHPERDEVGVVVESPLIAHGRLKLRIAFPYALNSFGPDYQDWNKPEAHQTVLTRRAKYSATFARTLDETHYFVRAKWSDGGRLEEIGSTSVFDN